MSKRNFFYRLNPSEAGYEMLLAPEPLEWAKLFFKELAADDPETAILPIAKRMIQEAHSFRAKRSEAGKASAGLRSKAQHEATYVEHMMGDVEHEATNVQQCSTSSSSSTEELKSSCASFDAFYSAYPRKRNRGAAERAWRTLKPSEEVLRKMLDAIAVARETEDWKKDKGKFIPYPATWLRATGWLDEHGNEISDYQPARLW